MNQDEEIPTRVTRGALRRRSVDQEATPQKPSGTASTGTPKKTNSTTKRVNALNPIRESEGRPSTPIAGRTTRRRMSETIDTPTTLPNKLVQNLKETEKSSDSGRRSRNASLTEENLNELNVAYEGSSGMLPTRSRTPARIRASHETLATTGSPATVTPAVRRSTRRNSVTSDDGNISVQSLPVTTSKLSSGMRVLKDDTILEEDASDDRAGSVSSEPSIRQIRSHSSTSASPRSTAASPVLIAKHESTPPRTSTIPRVSLTPLSLPKTSPRSKNVSFNDDSKREDNQSSFPKTPTSVSKEVFILVEDLRKSEFKGVSPKVDALVDLSPNTMETKDQEQSVCENVEHDQSNCENVEHDNPAPNETIESNTEEQDKTNASSSKIVVQEDDSTVKMISANDVSGIDVLESSVIEKVGTNADKDTATGNDSIRSADQSISEGNKFSQSWSQSVRRSATKGIDEYSVRKQEEQERQEQEAKESLQMAKMDSSFKASSPATQEEQSEKSDEEHEDEEEMEQNNEFIDDEALEVEDYQSCDSMDDELKREMEENEIPDHGEDLGSEDTEENDDQEDDEEDNDSWVVSDGDEEQLLRSSDEDQSTQKSLRRRIVDSEEKEEDESIIPFDNKSSPLKSPKSTTNISRSATPASALQTSGIETVEENLAKPATPTTPSKMSSPVKISSNKKQLSESIEASSERENETMSCSAVLFEDAVDGNEKGQQSDKDGEREVSFLKSPKSTITPRKSFPDDGINHTDSHIIADARNILPASAEIQVYEKSDAIQEEKILEIDNEESKEEVIDLEKIEEGEALYEDNKALNESSSSQVTLEQPVNEVSKPDRKSMPPVSLVSAQFYIGATKKRNTVGGGETSMLTSTPKPNESSAVTNKKNKSVEVEKVNSSDSNSVVPNPFALANSAKLKSRASLDSGTAIQQNIKKSRRSLPTKFDEEDLPPETGTGVNGSQEPEPMEVDEVIEEEDVVNEEATKQNDDGETDDDVSVQEVVKEGETQRTTKVKPKPKALEDYDLTNILDRCNEVMREDKERKRQLASALRKKKVEKKRMRELEKQEELEAAKHAAKIATDNGADPSNASVSTCNDSTGQGEEPTKKKKKRKPKVKNYLLEELAETKKERMEQALRHKLEVIERRKQRKKDRQLEKKNQVDKENGDSVTVTGGIGAKLEKMKKKQKAKTSNAAKEHDPQDPSIGEALSAFAVFNQLQNNQPLSPSIAAANGNEIQSSDNAQLVVMSAGEKKQLPKPSNKKESSNEQQNSKEIVKTKKLGHADVQESKTEARKEPVGKAIENQTEKLLTPAVAVRQALSTDDVAVGKKKQNLTAQPAEALAANSKKSPPLLQSASDGLMEDAGKMSRKQKKKQALAAAASEGAENVEQKVLPITEETAPYIKDEKPKEPKKRKKEQVAELPSNGAGSDIPKQEKNKKIKLNGAAAAEDQIKIVQAKLSSAIGELHPAVKHVEKTKKNKKKLASQTENDAMMEDGNTIELSGKKPTPTPTMPVTSNAPAKKRKREQQQGDSVASTPRPAKHTKLRVLQRIESGGFFEENVTPDKVRLKRNFGFQERPATPAKQLGFKVSSILPTGQEELQSMATAAKKYSKDGRKKSKFGDAVLPERNRSLPLPVWTSSGVFFESAADTNGDNSNQKKTQKEKSGYIQLKSQGGGGKGEFNVKSLRPALIAEKSHRVDPATIDGSALNFKRQQLLEKTAHLREKKKNQRV